MRCEKYIRYLSPYMDSELDANTCVEIADHLAVCEECHTRFAHEQEIEKLLAERLRDVQMPGYLWRRIESSINIREHTPVYSIKSRINLKWLVPVIATAVLAIGLSVFFFWVRTPRDEGLILALQDIHERYLKEEIAAGHGMVWPEGFKQMSLPGRIPRTGNIGGHDVRLISVRPHYLRGTEMALLEYSCCGEPVVVFILRKESLGNFPQARDLLDRTNGLVRMTFEDTNLIIVDVGEAVVCGVSCHELNTLLRAFRRV